MKALTMLFLILGIIGLVVPVFGFGFLFIAFLCWWLSSREGNR